MTLIMPPEQLHLVYKTETSFAVGGHGLLWEAIQLSEVSCRMDNITSTLSNDIHSSMLLVHAALALQLPETVDEALSSGRTLGELQSIIRLVLDPSVYRLLRAGPNSATDKRYNKIECQVVERAAKKILRGYQQVMHVVMPARAPKSGPLPVEIFSWATLTT
ncbi:hypothetical protein FRC01_003424 [Tulasnella sp. 417]|nr:hypothetical protein FRC01_003424 [Tulasnella sp. 417]